MPSATQAVLTRELVLRRLDAVHESLHADGVGTLRRVLTTLDEMLRDRGCTTREGPRPDDADGAMEAIVAVEPVLRGRSASGDVAWHAYLYPDKVGVKVARAALAAVEAAGARCVMVSTGGPTPFTRRECESTDIQFFSAQSLTVNITRHTLVPHHERVDAPPEGVKPEELPRMLITDPIAFYHAWPPGSVVRIARRLGGHETLPYFRIVVAGPGGLAAA